MNERMWLIQFRKLFGSRKVFDHKGLFLKEFGLLIETSDRDTVYRLAHQHYKLSYERQNYVYDKTKATRRYPLIPQTTELDSPEEIVAKQQELEKNIVFSNVMGVTPWNSWAGYSFKIYEFTKVLSESADQCSGTDAGYFWRFTNPQTREVRVFRTKPEAELFAHSQGYGKI